MQPIKLFILQMYFLCRILSATARAADQPNPCRLLPGRNGERKGSADMPKILSAHDAVRQYIHDGDTVTFGGFASGLMHPESILRALEERARNGEGPHGLTALYAAGQGDSDSRGLNHLGVEGLCRRVIGGHWGLSPKLGRLCADNKLAGIFTHGDFVRAYGANPLIGEQPVSGLMTRNPIYVMEDDLAAEAVKAVSNRHIDDLVVLNAEMTPVGIVDLQDLARLKLV